jgi:hypothetical protein
MENGMDVDISQAALCFLKSQARTLRDTQDAAGRPVSQAEALEMVARSHGLRNWNTLRAQAMRRQRLGLNTRVTGRYLGQKFRGRVHALGPAQVKTAGAFRVVLHFDEPVDVVQFDSFSAMRQRVAGTLGANGQSFDTTSDGAPHLTLDWIDG